MFRHLPERASSKALMRGVFLMSIVTKHARNHFVPIILRLSLRSRWSGPDFGHIHRLKAWVPAKLYRPSHLRHLSDTLFRARAGGGSTLTVSTWIPAFVGNDGRVWACAGMTITFLDWAVGGR